LQALPFHDIVEAHPIKNEFRPYTVLLKEIRISFSKVWKALKNGNISNMNGH
jgi:hypothetical protein